MRILVLSDSHGALRFMRQCIRHFRPDGVIHLGDYYDDGQVFTEENPSVRMHQVPGNCDRYRMTSVTAEILCYPIGGVPMMMTHGHLHNVKRGTDLLLADARKRGVQAVLFGHTHIPECYRENGLWVLNPGSCSGAGGSVGLLEIQDRQIVDCRVIKLADLEETI